MDVSAAPAGPGTVTAGWEWSQCSPAQQKSPSGIIFPQRQLVWRYSDLSSRPPWAASKENCNGFLALSELGSFQPGSGCSLPLFLWFCRCFSSPFPSCWGSPGQLCHGQGPCHSPAPAQTQLCLQGSSQPPWEPSRCSFNSFLFFILFYFI